MMDPDLLFLRWGLPGCKIRVEGGEITSWEGCSIPEPPTAEQYAEAVAEYPALLQREKPQDQKHAENGVVKILRKHGLPDDATTEQIEAALLAIPDANLPVKDAIAALTYAVALIFRRLGGADIHEHPELEE